MTHINVNMNANLKGADFFFFLSYISNTQAARRKNPILLSQAQYILPKTIKHKAE